MAKRRTVRASGKLDVTTVITILPAVDAGLAILEGVPQLKPYVRGVRKVTRLGAATDPAVLRKLFNKLSKP